MSAGDAWRAMLAQRSEPADPARMGLMGAESPRLYWVLEGAVDLFLTRLDASGAAQALFPVCRIEAGQMLLNAPLPQALSAFRLRWVPLPESRIVALDDTLLASSAASGELESACQHWIGTLVRATNGGLVPQRYTLIDTGAPVSLAAGEIGAVAVGMAWLEVTAGQVLLMGEPQSAFSAGSLFCLHADAWLTAQGDAQLVPHRLDDCLRRSLLLPMLLGMQGALLQAISARQTTDDEMVRERMEQRRHSANQQMGGALRRLVGVLQADRFETAPLETHDKVLAACRIVGRPLGIDFPDLPRTVATAASGQPLEERLAVVAQVARVQKRRVALRGQWWEEDAGPLVAFNQETNEPLALLPIHGKAKSKYVAVDPQSGVRTPVDVSLAQTLAPFAFGFFLPLPARRLTLVDLLRLGLTGRGHELTLVMVVAALLGLMGLLAPIAIGYLFDQVIPEADRPQIYQMTVGLLGAALATLSFSLLRAEVLLRLEGKMEAVIQAAVWDRVLKLPVNFFRDYAAGDLAQRVNAINTIHQQLSGAALTGLLTGLFSFLNLALLFFYAPMLALLGVALVTLALAVNGVALFLALAGNRSMMALQGKLSGQVLEYLNGITKLRAAAAEARAFARWAVRYAESKAIGIRVRTIQNTAEIFLTAFSVLASAVLFYAIGTASGGAALSTGAFVAFTGAFAGFFVNFIIFSNTSLGLLQIVPLLERARPILDTLPEIDLARAHPGVLQGEITVSNVVFRYRPEGPPALNGVSFTARPGEFIAIVGPSGSGKSTLIRLLLGFEQAESGSIYFDGKDLADLDVQAVRRQIGVVLQSGQLMAGDIFSNIVGTHPLTVNDAWDAARLCGLDTDIEAMPMGMHTVLAEGTSTLSGGQRQRILIARAIVRRPRILLFDEATSALDNRTQALVSQSIERLKATRIVIAHRLSTILNADRILVMQAGHVVQSGTYAELMAQPGLFRELAERQLA